MIKKVRNILRLMKTIDFDQIEKISKKVDLGEVLGAVSKMDEKQLQMAMKMLTGSQKKRTPPAIDADFYDVEERLSPEDRALQLKVRAFLEAEVKPLVNKYWLKDEFPFELIPKLAELNVWGLFICVVPMSKSRNGCRQCSDSKKSVPLV